jgi:predicted transcriptional regulator
MTKAGLDKSTFVQAYDELVQSGIEAAKLTPEMVGQYWTNKRTVEKIETRLSDINAELATEENIERLATLAIQTGATEQEIEEVIQQLYANQAEKKLAKKINKTLKAKESAPAKRAGSDPMFFDDLTF